MPDVTVDLVGRVDALDRHERLRPMGVAPTGYGRSRHGRLRPWADVVEEFRMNADEAVNALIAGHGTAEDVVAALLPLVHEGQGPRTPIGLDVEIDPESPAFRLYSGYINGRVSREDYATVLDALRRADDG